MDKNKEKVKLNDELLNKVSRGAGGGGVRCPNCLTNDVTIQDGIGYCDRCRVHFELE